MFGRVLKNAAPCLGTRPNISESHSEISTRVPFCIGLGWTGQWHDVLAVHLLAPLCGVGVDIALFEPVVVERERDSTEQLR